MRILKPVLILICIACAACHNKERTWSAYKADAESTSYSPLDEVNKENVQQLKVAWSFYPNDAAEGTRFASSQSNPIVIDGVMYSSSARHRIYAIDAATGKQIWSFDPFDGGPGGGSFRGVTYWEDGKDKRILFTGGDVLFALKAETGELITTFGQNGKVSMNVGMRDDSSAISIKPTSPGIIYKDLIIIGNEVSELYGAQPGYVRAYNVRSGKLEWTFHTVPKPGEVGYDTWPKDAWKYAGGANCWGGLSVDTKRGLVIFGTGSPTYDFYGADRKGKNLFGNSIVALDAATGKYVWHFQTIHHDLWDYDLPAPPNLLTVTMNGKKIDAVAQTSKIGFLYVLDRQTGEPLFPVEERPVPASDVPGEEVWPTQPFPLKPAPYARQQMTVDDLFDHDSTSRDSLVKVFKSLRYEGLFTPPSLRGTLNLPGTIGGSEWGGAAVDPASGVIYLKSNESPEISQLQKIEETTPSNAQSGYDAGKTLYTNYCASCHKADKSGDEPLYPSLIGVKERMNEQQVLTKIRDGGGKMPPFASVLKGNEKAIVDFLFDNHHRYSQKDADLAEIQTNLKAGANKSGKIDTFPTYLNTLAYAQFRGPDGNSAIKPPWGTLNAIDLNTGDYLWKVPVGNYPHLQKEGGAETGSTGSPGPMVTAGGLVFIGGTRDKKFRAFDKTTGQVLWEMELPGFASSVPCSYRSNGKQYIAVSVAGNKEKPAGFIMAFALPD